MFRKKKEINKLEEVFNSIKSNNNKILLFIILFLIIYLVLYFVFNNIFDKIKSYTNQRLDVINLIKIEKIKNIRNERKNCQKKYEIDREKIEKTINNFEKKRITGNLLKEAYDKYIFLTNAINRCSQISDLNLNQLEIEETANQNLFESVIEERETLYLKEINWNKINK